VPWWSPFATQAERPLQTPKAVAKAWQRDPRFVEIADGLYEYLSSDAGKWALKYAGGIYGADAELATLLMDALVEAARRHHRAQRQVAWWERHGAKVGVGLGVVAASASIYQERRRTAAVISI
jgi:hypothetical protein